ncbi:MAG: hypothetical protein AAF789_08110 [Bacteroidota bacterium]
MSEAKKHKSWKIILLSFIGASIFWFFSALGKSYNARIDYPVFFDFDRDSLVTVGALAKNIKMDLYGGGWDLLKQTLFFGAEEPIVVKLANPVSTRFLTKQDLLPIISDQLSDKFRINFILTDSVLFQIESRDSLQLVVSLDSISIDLAANHRITSDIVLSADTVTIHGPTSFLDTLEDKYTFSLSSEEIDEPYDQNVTLGLPEIGEIRSDPPTIRVNFEVKEFEEVELASKVEAIDFPADSSVFLEDDQVKISFAVERELASSISSSDFKVVADFNMIVQDSKKVPLIVLFQAEQIQDLTLIPDSLQLIIRDE